MAKLGICASSLSCLLALSNFVGMVSTALLTRVCCAQIFAAVLLGIAALLSVRQASAIGLGLFPYAFWLLILAAGLFVSSLIGLGAACNQSSVMTRIVHVILPSVVLLHAHRDDRLSGRHRILRLGRRKRRTILQC